MATTNQFTVRVVEVNVAPVLEAVAPQTVDQLTPLNVALVTTDPDQPASGFVYEVVEGPAGLSVNGTGTVSWVPGAAQVPSTNEVEVRVTDGGVPPLSAVRQFTVVALPVEERSVWQVGIDNDPQEQPYIPYDEFDAQNNLNDPPPGRVTRLPGDPEYVASANPARDDDFYTGGLYPGGFNGLAQLLIVPSDEPAVAWEHSLTVGDRANRLHFRLTEAQVSAGSWLRFDMDLALGGSLMGGQMQPGFAEHDVVIRFRNGAGVATEIYSERVTAAGVVRVEFPVSGVQATAGANTLEVVRTGPALPGISYWLTFDYLRLEADAGGNEAPVIAGVGVQTVDELKALTVNLQGTDGDKPPTPLTYGLVSGPEGLTVSADGVVNWTPTEGQGPSVNAVVVRVTDNGVPPMSATNEFEVVVREVNRAPVIGAVAGQAVEEQKAWTLALGVADEDLPQNQFSYGLVSGPEGLEVSAGGVVSWTPTEGQGPSVNTVVVRVTDNGVPPLSGTNQFTVTVAEVNRAPVLGAVTAGAVEEMKGWTQALVAEDADQPANTVK